MSGGTVNFSEAAAKAQAPDGEARAGNERSGISFPYHDLDAAVEVARALYARAGISSCPMDELAAQMGQTTSSGSFRLKTSTAKIFGLIEREGGSGTKLSDLGCKLVSPESEAEAKADAFMVVPLYAQIFEKYRGKLLPPTKALEREMQMLGVSSKQTDKARFAFHRSAKQAGYFHIGEDRLVRPRMGNAAAETIDQDVADARPQERLAAPRRFAGGGGGGGGKYHPFVEGLLERLPEPDTVWTIEGRAAWLEAAASVFKLIYQGDGRITIEAEPKRGSAQQNGRSHRETAA